MGGFLVRVPVLSAGGFGVAGSTWDGEDVAATRLRVRMAGGPFMRRSSWRRARQRCQVRRRQRREWGLIVRPGSSPATFGWWRGGFGGCEEDVNPFRVEDVMGWKVL